MSKHLLYYDNEVNEGTFTTTKLNRSYSSTIRCYYRQWVDPDLGYYLDDDYVDDVGPGSWFCYNGDAEDEGAAGHWKFNPPAIGVDFFKDH